MVMLKKISISYIAIQCYTYIYIYNCTICIFQYLFEYTFQYVYLGIYFNMYI